MEEVTKVYEEVPRVSKVPRVPKVVAKLRGSFLLRQPTLGTLDTPNFRHFFILGFVIFISLVGCVNSEEYEKIKKEFRDVEYSNNYKSFDSIYKEIPNYSEVSTSISKFHSKFNKEILLDPAKVDLYLNSKETSIAMGMYIADLGYVRHFERVQLCMNYLESVQVLANKLAIGTKEFNEMVPRIEQSLENKEQLYGLIDSLMNSSSFVLESSEKYGISALFLGGFWLESLHIGLSSDIAKNEELKTEVLDAHFRILTQINKLFDCLDDDSVLKEFKQSLKTLETKGSSNQNLISDVEKIRKLYLK
jgi:hypothetical protein